MNTYTFGNCTVACCTPVINSTTNTISGSDNVITVNFTACTPADTFHLWYRPLGDTGAYRDGGTKATSPFIKTDSSDTPGTNYEGYIQSECGETLGTPVNFSNSCKTCGDFFTLSHPDNTAYTYPDVCLELGGLDSVTISFDTHDRPNRITIFDNASTLYTSGWRGFASYPGPWGASLGTSETGSFTFTPVDGHVYTISVNVGNGDPDNPQSDSCDIGISCS